jgi:outer membrane protein OmpA-like peptidoglycan-associated protein
VKTQILKPLLAGLAVAALLSGGCQSAYQKTYDENLARLEAEQRLRDEQEAAQREAERRDAQKYVAIVLYAPGSDEIDETGYRELNWFLEKIAPYPHVSIDIKGYTDATGSESTNVPLSNKRAWKAQDYLVSQGVAAYRIHAEGYGASDPARPNVTPSGRVQNRRAEVRVR